MLVELNLRLLAKYLLYPVSVLVYLCAQLIYCRDLDQAVASFPVRSNEMNIAVLNAQVYYYINSGLAYVMYLHLIYPVARWVCVFTVGLTLLLLVRLSTTNYFNFPLNIGNLMGALLGAFYLICSWYKWDFKRLINLPIKLEVDGHNAPNGKPKEKSRRSKRSQRKRRKEAEERDSNS